MHTYEMLRRPFDIGCQPRGQSGYVDCDKRRDGYFGLVSYDKPLTEDDINRYELRKHN